MLMPNGPPRSIGLELGARRGAHPVSACASGAEAIGLALEMIRSGRADVVVAGGTEACHPPAADGRFAADAGAVHPQRRARARVASVRQGPRRLRLGEGAGLVLESEEHARRAVPRSTPRSPGPASSDSHHIAQPDPDRRRRGRAITLRRPSSDAGACPRPTSSTSTPTHVDAAGRRRRGRRSAGRSATPPTASWSPATKSMTGHLLGAAGAVESDRLTVLALHRDRLAPADDQPRGPDPTRSTSTSSPPASPATLPDGDIAALNNSFGFGGHNVALVFRSADDPGPQRQARKVKVDRADPRNPLAPAWRRSSTPGLLELITAEDDSAACSPPSAPSTAPRRRLLLRPHVQGGAMGNRRLPGDRAAYERALADGVPVVGLWHSGGARLAEGVASLHAVGEVFAIMTRASGKVPQISSCSVPAAGGAAYGPALTDVVILGPEGRVFVTGPDVVRSVTGEDVDMLRLGGPEPHGRRSGVVHVVADSEQRRARAGPGARAPARRPGTLDRGLGRRPSTSSRAAAPESASAPTTCTRSSRRARRGHRARRAAPKWAPNIVTRWAASAAAPSASSPTTRCASAAASTPQRREGRRFVRMCDAFGVPLVVLVDVPGYLPGVGQEWDGVVRRGAKLLHAFAEASCRG
jgi:acetyl-CoA/propionyl-CoA carboxylase carboxyl transferase subunit